ncbi:MAG: FTR1 family iron permease [Flexistipes sinusarabici]|uniref:FTR1 family iron permease n=1 Tax=Flexistipes sinusarabici TaxID=2352 RepID=A0A5D0MQH3_FLESI|nr:FTR1 family protein [Flexistipes sinusarabici]TYB33009.1 MAG: FTR1 family iron permease [Flexistipes sinusarabici]
MIVKSKIFLAALFALLFVTTFSPAEAAGSWNDVTSEIKEYVDNGLKEYNKGNVRAAKQNITDAYFRVFEEEEMEQAIQANIGGQTAFKVEYMFGEIKKLMDKGASQQEVAEMAGLLIKDLNTYSVQLNELAPRKEQSPFQKLLYSLLIILREGFEAILIISAILAYLIKSGNKEKAKIVYNSTAVAIGASILTAFLFEYVLDISGLGQELLEGITMLLATAVLFFVSYWLISKVEAKKWQKYIEGKVENSLKTGNLWALWFVVFLAVYREGAETVLFYQALIADTDPSAYGMIALGFLIGCAGLVVMFLVIERTSLKLPLKPFFLGTSALLYYLAFVFAGQGVRELQESGVIGATALNGFPTIGWLGVYPTYQTVILQAIIIAAGIFAVMYNFIPKRAKA